eukprot:scaffold2428_cov412-Prasinococcus_capsulatus_cf.AAC.9
MEIQDVVCYWDSHSQALSTLNHIAAQVEKLVASGLTSLVLVDFGSSGFVCMSRDADTGLRPCAEVPLKPRRPSSKHARESTMVRWLKKV